MLNLFENYNEPERDLEHSLGDAGYTHSTVVLNDNGFLPKHVISPVGFFTGMDKEKEISSQKARFFNELSLPAYWEIRADGSQAGIYEGYKKKGQIRYSNRPGDYRLIEAVEWLNDLGKVRVVDLYNQNGHLYGKETYSDGAHVLSTFFDTLKREVLLFNHVTQTIQVNLKGKSFVFEDYNSFILFFFKVAELPVNKIFYNSLGRPFFITNALKRVSPEQSFQHTLFWQEISQEMPGNMQGIFKESQPATTHIVVQNRDEYVRLMEQLNQPSIVKMDYLGYLYDFKKEAILNTQILIHTNSDQLVGIQELTDALPNMTFTIAARTEMSQKLVGLEKKENVRLYPNVTTEDLQQLVLESSFYLDVNRGGEVDNILRQAFEHNLLILGFKETQHNPRLVYPQHMFEVNNKEALISTLKNASNSQENYHAALQEQVWAAGQETVENYKDVLS